MTFSTSYNCIQNSDQKWTTEDNKFSIIPIRFKDRLDIMKWRNEQIYHLRQKEPLTKENQDYYYTNIVSKIFNEKQPDQILFSYLENDVLVGYGGLVHINWYDKNAEISFIMDTNLEEKYFQKHWINFLNLLEKVAFEELFFHKIYTYAFDIRPKLFNVIEEINYKEEAILNEHFYFNNTFRNIRIHSKINPISIRDIIKADCDILFEWANESTTRANSINSSEISYYEHRKWFDENLQNQDTTNYICLLNNHPIGIVRFEDKNEISIISITINPIYRGKKLASKFLKMSVEYFSQINDSKIVAYIKPSNLASIKSFEKSNFYFVKNELVNDVSLLKFQYKND